MVATLILQFISTCLLAPVASASPSQDGYIESLKLAQRKVERQNGNGIRGSGLAAVAALNGTPSERSALISSDVLNQIAGRPYRVGDTWEVAAIRMENPAARMTSDPNHLKVTYSAPALFRYTVKESETGPEGRLVVQVEQISGNASAPVVDPKVKSLTLTLAQDSTQTRKEYQIGRASIPVSPEGIRSSISALEFYPLDLPEIRTAEASPSREFPEIPEKLRSVAGSRLATQSNPDSILFEQDDFFGRPVQALWRKGDPWPAYLKTANGIAVLLSGGSSR